MAYFEVMTAFLYIDVVLFRRVNFLTSFPTTSE